MKNSGWDEKIINLLYPHPDRIAYLGRGRYAYYYNVSKVSQLEDSEEFIEHIAAKLERKIRRTQAHSKNNNSFTTGFGPEFIK